MSDKFSEFKDALIELNRYISFLGLSTDPSEKRRERFDSIPMKNEISVTQHIPDYEGGFEITVTLSMINGIPYYVGCGIPFVGVIHGTKDTTSYVASAPVQVETLSILKQYLNGDYTPQEFIAQIKEHNPVGKIQ